MGRLRSVCCLLYSIHTFTHLRSQINISGTVAIAAFPRVMGDRRCRDAVLRVLLRGHTWTPMCPQRRRTFAEITLQVGFHTFLYLYRGSNKGRMKVIFKEDHFKKIHKKRKNTLFCLFTCQGFERPSKWFSWKREKEKNVDRNDQFGLANKICEPIL